MAKARDALVITNSAGKVVAQLVFRKECTPEIFLGKGYKYHTRKEYMEMLNDDGA